MKKAIVLATALLASSAQATSGLDFGDLNYFLKAGQLNLKSDLAVVNAEQTDETAGTRSEFNGYVLTNTLGVGIMDNLNVFAGLDYAYKYETSEPGQPDSDNSGLSNPYAGANFRLINQADSLVNFDLGAVAHIQVMDAEIGTDGKDGTYNQGNHSLELNSSIGRKWNEANEWRLTAAVVRNFDGEYDSRSSSGKSKVDTDASMDMSLTAAYQYRPVQEFMMNVALQALRVGEVEGKSGGTKVTADAHTDFNFTFSAKYLITESIIGKFNYGISRLAEYDVTTGGTTSEQKDVHQNFYGLGIDLLF